MYVCVCCVCVADWGHPYIRVVVILHLEQFWDLSIEPPFIFQSIFFYKAKSTECNSQHWQQTKSRSPPVFNSNFALLLSSDIIVTDTANSTHCCLQIPSLKDDFYTFLTIDFFFCNMELKSRRVGLLHDVTVFSQGVCPTLIQEQIPLRAENVRKPLLN